MKKIILSAMAVLALLGAVNVNAALFGSWGVYAYRDGRSVEGQAIAWEFLNDQKIYAKVDFIESLNREGVNSLCNQAENRHGKRLFDIEQSICLNPVNPESHGVYFFTFDSQYTKWNYHLLIAPTNMKDKLDGQIAELQMGSTITRVPPKILRVMEKSDSCKDDGFLMSANKKIVCNGWSWESLRQYWGKDVPPELKALNGTGAPKQVEAPLPATTEPPNPVVVTNPQ